MRLWLPDGPFARLDSWNRPRIQHSCSLPASVDRCSRQRSTNGPTAQHSRKLPATSVRCAPRGDSNGPRRQRRCGLPATVVHCSWLCTPNGPRRRVGCSLTAGAVRCPCLEAQNGPRRQRSRGLPASVDRYCLRWWRHGIRTGRYEMAAIASWPCRRLDDCCTTRQLRNMPQPPSPWHAPGSIAASRREWHSSR